jgi:ATP-binding cassette, subfamily B, bacterial
MRTRDHHTLIAEGGLYKRLYEAQNVDPDLVYPATLVGR